MKGNVSRVKGGMGSERLARKLEKKIVSELPSTSVLYDFTNGASLFTARSNASVSVDEGVQAIAITSKAGTSSPAIAYFDFSDAASGAKTVVIEYDSQIDGGRWGISLVDVKNRPTAITGSGINTTGAAFWHGTKNGSVYYINGAYSSTWGSFFGDKVHVKIVADIEARTLNYTVTSSDGSITASGTDKGFIGTATEITGIEFYSWLGGQTAYIDNISITAIFETVENVIYMIPSGDGYDLYMYMNNIPVLVASHAVTTVTYSEKPVQIGTWIDGTPIWRVAFPFIKFENGVRHCIANEATGDVLINIEDLMCEYVMNESAFRIISRNITAYDEVPAFLCPIKAEIIACIYFLCNDTERYTSLVTEGRGYWGGYIDFIASADSIKIE